MMEPLTNNEQFYDSRINARMKSAEWDLGMARNVLRRRRRKQYLLGASGSAGSVAAAVILALFLTAMPAGTRYGEGLNSFVNAQVQGTWNQVFAGANAQVKTNSVFVEAEFDQSVDTMIDETLAQRL